MALIFLSIACIANSVSIGYLIYDLYFKFRGVSFEPNESNSIRKIVEDDMFNYSKTSLK